MNNEAVLPFRDRAHAGRLLAGSLMHHHGHEGVLVLALPRGGVALGYEVARAIDAPLDVFVVRKLGYPGHEEYAIGALASGGVRVMNPLPGATPDPAALAEVVAREEAELLRREQLYRNQRPPVNMTGRTIIVIDDGLATGSTMRAAALSIRQQRPAHLAVAVPVGSQEGCEAVRDQVDELVCLATPEPFEAVSLWYRNFPQATDEEVRKLLQDARRERALHLS